MIDADIFMKFMKYLKQISFTGKQYVFLCIYASILILTRFLDIY